MYLQKAVVLLLDLKYNERKCLKK